MSAQDIFTGCGVVFVAPYGTPLPTLTTDTLDPAFRSLGEVNEDGLEHAFTSDTTTMTNWCGQTIKTLATNTEITFQLTFLEHIKPVIERFWGAEAVVANGETTLELGTPKDDPFVMVIRLVNGDRVHQFQLPAAQVTERESLVVKPDETGFGMTFTAQRDAVAKTNGTLLHNYEVADGDAPDVVLARTETAPATATTTKTATTTTK